MTHDDTHPAALFAASVGAKVTFPTDPERKRHMDAPADVAKTWSLYRPAADFDNVPSLTKRRKAA
jgi:hypothetical protein